MSPERPGPDLGTIVLEPRQLREVLSHVPDPMVVVDPRGRIVFASRQVASVLGWPVEELVGKPVHVLIPSRLQQGHAEHLRGFFTNPTARPMGQGLDLVALTRDGRELPVDISLASVGAGPGQLVVANIRDISARCQAMEVMSRLNRELVEKSAELEGLVGDLRVFAQTASHDLQAPLRQVTQFLSLLQRRCAQELSDEGQDYVRFAIESATRMRNMIRNVLDYSKIGSSEQDFQFVELGDVVAQVVSTIRLPIQEAGARIDHSGLPRVWGDRSQLAQLFQNLFTNALVHRSDAAPEVHLSARRDGDHWVISVRDNGLGIDPSHHARIFEMFQRATGAQLPGTGVGLAICKRVIDRHHGRIWVESTLGAGACFCFTLPARGADATDGAGDGAPASAA